MDKSVFVCWRGYLFSYVVLLVLFFIVSDQTDDDVCHWICLVNISGYFNARFNFVQQYITSVYFIYYYIAYQEMISNPIALGKVSLYYIVRLCKWLRIITIVIIRSI